MKKVLVWIGVLVLLGCAEQTEIIDKKEVDFFDILGPEETGIDFVNYLKEGERMNGLFYEYFYNGGGVAVGDVNNDGKQDIYFTSNLQSNKLYLNEGQMKFRDITRQAGVRGKYGFSTGTTMVDINQDGWMDIYVCKSGQFNDPDKRRNELWVNQGVDESGVPTFVEKAASYGLDCPQFSTQVAFFDFDRDNDLDMFLINHGIKSFEGGRVAELAKEQGDLRGERLFENRDGFYHDITQEAKIINNNLGYCLGLGIGDLNNDQWPDVYVSVDYSGKDHLYINQRDGTFKESIIETTGHISNFSMGNDIADFNNDGRADIVVVDMASESYYDIKTSMGGMNPKKFNELVDLNQHYQYMFNTLQLNRGVSSEKELPRFSEIAQMSGVSSSDWSWAPLLFDMDNDGQKDLFVSNGIKRDFRNNDFVIYRKKQDEKVKQIIKEGKKWDIKRYVEDLLQRMPSRKKPNNFYLNEEGLRFSKIEKETLQQASFASNGAAYADFDQDGDLDLVVNNSDDPAFIYRNNADQKNDNNYLNVALKGPQGNINGLGAKIALLSQGQWQYVEQFTSRGFQSSVSNEIHFGVGPAEDISELRVTWPDGKQQTLGGLEVNQKITLNHENAADSELDTTIQTTWFSETSRETLNFKHKENGFDDFSRESLLPHQMSRFGPSLAVADVNGDGLEDVYLGGAVGQAGTLFLQTTASSFRKVKGQPWSMEKNCEDVDALFFDADGDGDNDLYVVSGGNEHEVGSIQYQDRLYLNDGKGTFSKSQALPRFPNSGSKVVSSDYDQDGDLDLFVGGRQVPGQYPLPASSTLLRNDSQRGKVVFTDVAEQLAPGLQGVGMVTGASFGDFNQDQVVDLMIVGEWMNPVLLVQIQGRFVNQSEDFGLHNEKGWWFSLLSYDFDQDGDLDFVAGNLGENYKYHASPEEPFEVYAHDFDGSGSLDIVLGYQKQGSQYALRGRECSSNQMPFIKEKFPTYDQFAKASLVEVYGEAPLRDALHYQAYNFNTTYFENVNGAGFEARPLPVEAQLSVVNSLLSTDVNEDGHMDIIMAGNLFVAEVETVRSDAGMGIVLLGDGSGNFTPVESEKSGLFLHKDVRGIKAISLGEKKNKGIIVANNDDYVQVIQKNMD
ncbi:VCBS repeat-containing protein [Reichenbachiella sp.]|uniref:VCBS repeat-containing protein n=1 Tax=Reichenbachiella sp. TaxID=2184521 RepID=UPI003BB06C33